MTIRQPPSYLAYEDVQHTARNDRITTGASFTPGDGPLLGRSGALIGPAGAMGEVSLPDQGTVRVGPGIFLLQGAVDSAQGQYIAINDADYDQPIGATQDASQFRRIAVTVAVLDSVMAGAEPQQLLDGDGNPEVDADGNPVLGFATPTNLADVYLVAGDLDPAAPGPNPVIDPAVYQAAAVLGWINVPPAGQALTYTANPAARVGSRTGILPTLAGDDEDGSHVYAYRHRPDNGLEYFDAGGVWRGLFTDTMTANRLRLNSTTDAAAASTGHGFQVGPDDGPNIIIDTNEVMARVAGAVVGLYLGRPALGGEGAWDLAAPSTPGSALVSKDFLTAQLARTTATTLRLTATADASPTSTGHALQIGIDTGPNLRIDNNELVAVNNGVLSNMLLTNPELSAETWNLAAAGTSGTALVTKAYVAPALADTGWVNFVPGSGWAVISSDGGCKYRVKAGILYLRFACTRASYGIHTTLVTFGTPFRPSVNQSFVTSYGNERIPVVMHADTGTLDSGDNGTGGMYLSASWPVG